LNLAEDGAEGAFFYYGVPVTALVLMEFTLSTKVGRPILIVSIEVIEGELKPFLGQNAKPLKIIKRSLCQHRVAKI